MSTLQTIVSAEDVIRGFRDVDRSNEIAAYAGLLELLDALPYYQEWKRRSFEMLSLSPGMTVLEVGCGLGDDARRMAELVGPDGKVTAVDASARMLEAASARGGESAQVDFRQADVRHLPFADGSFMRCRTERVLQHVERPEEAVAEMARVLEPGGLLAVYDNDWGTLSFSGADRATTERVQSAVMNGFANPWLGRQLKGLFMQAGLVDVEVVPSVSMFYDLDVADRVFSLRQNASRLVASGELTGEAAAAWLSDLQDQDSRGTFVCSLTAFTVLGRKR